MKIDQSAKGVWWIHGKTTPPLPGTLDTTEGVIKLTIWTPQNASIRQVLLDSISQQKQDVPQVIVGLNENNRPITLFGCVLSSTNMAQGFRQWDVDAIAIVRGIEISDWQQPFVHSLLIRPRFLHRWFGRKLLHANPGAMSFSFSESIDLEFPVESGVRIRFVDHTSPTFTLDENKFTHDCQIWLHYEDAQSLAKITSRWIPWVSRLLGLLMGLPCEIDDIEVYTEDPYIPDANAPGVGKLIRSGHNKERIINSDPLPNHMLIPYEEIRKDLARIVTEWNRVCTNFEPIVALFSTVVLDHSLNLEARFLFLVQALEIYYACLLKCISAETQDVECPGSPLKSKRRLPFHLKDDARGKRSLSAQSLANKLAAIFAAHCQDSAQLLGDLTVSADRIAYTRNHLIHHSDKVNMDRLIPQPELGTMSLKLEAILQVILLREIGLDGKCIRRVVEQMTDIRIIRC